MNQLMLAQLRLGNLSIVQIAIAIVVIGGVIALVAVALRKFGIVVPDWIVQVFWIVVVVVVIVLALQFLAGLF